jgi:beta-glucosidase-like glycosyl hydrolase
MSTLLREAFSENACTWSQVPEARVDAAVDRVLALKYKLGLLPQSPSCHQEGSSASRAPGHPDDRAEALQLVRCVCVCARASSRVRRQ